MPTSKGLRITLRLTNSTSIVEINIPDAVAATTTPVELLNDLPSYVCVARGKQIYCGSLMSALDKARRNP